MTKDELVNAWLADYYYIEKTKLSQIVLLRHGGSAGSKTESKRSIDSNTGWKRTTKIVFFIEVVEGRGGTEIEVRG